MAYKFQNGIHKQVSKLTVWICWLKANGVLQITSLYSTNWLYKRYIILTVGHCFIHYLVIQCLWWIKEH